MINTLIKIKRSTKIFIIAGIFIVVGLYAPVVFAESVQWSGTIPGSGYTYIPTAPGGVHTDSTKGWSFRNPQVSVTYSAQVRNLDTGTLLLAGAIIPVGTRIQFEPGALSTTNASWFGSGFSYDTPYGYWNANAAAPYGNECRTSDFVTSTQNGFLDLDIVNTGVSTLLYSPLSINPPTIAVNRSGSANLSCNTAGTICTVNSAGSINASVSFSATYGRFYIRFAHAGNASSVKNPTGGPFSPINPERTAFCVPWGAQHSQLTPPTVGQPTSLEVCDTYPNSTRWTCSDRYSPWTSGFGAGCVSYCGGRTAPLYWYPDGGSAAEGNAAARISNTLTIPAQNIPFTFTAVAPNGPPTAPIINGPTSVNTNQYVAYTFTSTDPDGDDIRYAFDWDSDDIINGYRPVYPNFTSSGTTESTSRSWTTTGPKTFRIRAFDENGNASAWSNYNVSVSTVVLPNPPPTPNFTCSVSSTGVVSGEVSWGAVSGATTYDIRLNNTRDPIDCISSPTNDRCPIGITATNRTFTNLVIGEEYEAQVRSCNASGVCGLYSPMSLRATCSPPLPPKPVTPTASCVADSSGTRANMIIGWTAVTGAVGPITYNAFVDATQVATNLPNTRTSYTHNGLALGSNHRARIEVCNSGGCTPSDATEIVSCPPGNPLDVTADLKVRVQAYGGAPAGPDRDDFITLNYGRQGTLIANSTNVGTGNCTITQTNPTPEILLSTDAERPYMSIGGLTTGQLTQPEYTYQLACTNGLTGSLERTAINEVTVYVLPAIDLRVRQTSASAWSNGPITIPQNSGAGLSWTGLNATACTVTRNPARAASLGGEPSFSGLVNTGASTGNLALSQTYTYTASCTNGNPSGSNSFSDVPIEVIVGTTGGGGTTPLSVSCLGYPIGNSIIGWTPTVAGGASGTKTYSWSFSDGTTSSQRLPTRTYTTGQTITATVEVTDADNARATGQCSAVATGGTTGGGDDDDDNGTTSQCGNNICEALAGENPITCSADCKIGNVKER